MAGDSWDEYSIFEVDPTLVRRGQEVQLTPETPEDLFKRLNERANQEAVAGRGISELERGTLQRAWESYQDWLRDHPAPAPAPVPRPRPVTKMATVPPVETRPSGADAPGPLGAPSVTTSTVVAATPAAVSSRAPTWATVSQQAPLAPEAVVEQLTPAPATEADRLALLDRLTNHVEEPGEPHPTLAGPAARTPARAVDPVELFTGALWLSVSDLVVPTATTPIAMQRFYRSGPPYHGPFGRGWDHCYDVYLRPLNDGSLAFWTGQLQERRFRPSGDGWEPEPGLTVRLERLAGVPDAFDVVHPGGLRWRLDRPPGWGDALRIPLVAITDRHGNAVRLTYDAEDRLATVLDEEGRGLRFGYGNCGLLEQVSDHTGARVVRYVHDDRVEHLARVVLPATAAFPDGIRTGYEYDDDADHPAMRDNLVRVVDGHGRTCLENEYAGPEEGWAFNSVVRQVSGGHEYQFEYEQLQYVPPVEIYVDVPASRTTVATPDRGLHVHTFNFRGDLLDRRFRLNRDGSFRVVATQMLYDAVGNCTQITDPDGVRHVMTYDAASPDPCARRNLLRIETAAAVSNVITSRLVQSTRYESRFALPTEVRDEAGATTRFVYDFDVGAASPTGRLERVELPPVTLPDGGTQQSVVRIRSDTRGRVTGLVLPEGTRTDLELVASGLHAGMLARAVSDPLGSRLVTAVEYDGVGHACRITRPGGRVTELRHNLNGQLEELTLPPVDGMSSTTRMWYGDAGSLERVEVPRGGYSDGVVTEPFIVDLVERDVLGRATATHLGANTDVARTSRQALDHEGRPVTSTDPAGALVKRRFDERGALLAETKAAGAPEEEVTRCAYDRVGRLVLAVDPGGGETRIDRDPWGRVMRVELPDGLVRRHVWGVRDLLLEVTDQGSPGPGLPQRTLARQTFGYDERGRRTSSTKWVFTDTAPTQTALTTRFTLDREDRPRRTTFPRGATSTFDHDALGRLVRVTDVHGSSREHRYDASGDLVEEIVSRTEGGVSRARTTTFEYDGRGRLTAVVDPSGRSDLAYDLRNIVTQHRGPGGVTTLLSTNPFGQITSSLLDPGGLDLRSTWVLDRAGRLAAFTDPVGATTTWQCDRLGRPSRLVLPDGSVWRYGYDTAGRRHERILPSGTTLTEQLDPCGRTRRLECLAGPGVEPVPVHDFDYDGLGRMVRAERAGGAVTRRYDSLGRLVEETADAQVVRVIHNDSSGDVDLVYPDGRRERTHHDPAGRPVEVRLVTPGAAAGGVAGEVLAAVEYAGGRTTVRHANGVKTALVYDQPGRLVELTHTLEGTLLDDYQARYDERQRRALVRLGGVPSRSTLHTFDARDRLTGARWGFPFAPLPDVASQEDHAAAIAAARTAAAAATEVEGFDLDGADGRERRTRTRPGSASVVDVNLLGPDHRVSSASGHAITHHADGPRSGDRRRRYDVDGLGRVVRVREAGSGDVLATFSYDALSRAAMGTVAGSVFARTYLGEAWIHETGGAGGDVRQATPHPLWPQPLQVRDGGEAFFPHPDEGLSTLCVTDAAGTVRERHRHGPFGEPELFAGDGTTALPLGAARPEPRWRGMPLVPALGLYAAAQRLYDPELGVFLARDPALYTDSSSPWVFAAHDPVDHLDPSGQAKSPLGEAPMEWRQTSLAELASQRYDRTMTYDLPPEETGYRGEDYFGYALIYGLKQTVWNPARAWLLDERPRYLDNQGQVQRTSWRPDRSGEMSIAVGTVAQLFMPTPKTPVLRGGLLDTLLGRIPGAELERSVMMSGKPGEVLTALENDIEVGYGADYTRVGNDPHTLRASDGRQPWPNTHDVIVHAESSGHRLSPGVAGPRGTWSVIETHEAQIAEAINMNPHLRPGQPIRLVACAVDAEQAQAIASLTGRPVFASPWTVGIDAGLGPLPVRQFVKWDPGLMSWASTAPEQAVWQLYWP